MVQRLGEEGLSAAHRPGRAAVTRAAPHALTLPFMLDVNKSLPVKSLPELVGHARGHPGSLNYGTLGNGSSNHLLGALLSKHAEAP